MTDLICAPRSRDRLLEVVAKIDPANNPKLKKRDVTGDGKDETFCNLFVQEFADELEAPIPHVLANVLFDDLAKGVPGWIPVDMLEAALRAELGYPTIGVWKNTSGHGHVVAVVPALDGAPGVHSAQAGLKNWNNAPIERAGLLAVAYRYYTHD